MNSLVGVDKRFAVCYNGSMSTNTINLLPFGSDEVQVMPAGYIGGDQFNSYKNACDVSGFRYRTTPDRANYGSILKVGELSKQLETAGFKVAMHPELASKVTAKVQEMREENSLAKTIVDRIGAVFGGFKLFPFQYVGVDAFVQHQRWLNFDDMGTGKTISSLVASQVVSVLRDPRSKSPTFSDEDLKTVQMLPTLVIVPAVVKFNWRDEANKWKIPYTKITVLKGRDSFRWPELGELVITNYDILPACTVGKTKNGTEILIAPDGCNSRTILIADEAHALKSPKALRTKRFRALRTAVVKEDGYIWLMTGTPILNKAPELWSIAAAADLTKEGFGDWTNFCRLFRGHQGRYGYVWGNPRPESALAMQKISLRRQLRDVMPELPPVTFKDVLVDVGKVTLKQCDEALKSLMGNVKASDENYDAILRQALEKVVQTKGMGAGFEKIAEARSALTIAKIPALLEFVEEYEEQEKPLIVFSAHRAPIEALATREGWAAIHGNVSHEQRTATVADFQAGKLKGVAITIKAGGVGITLTNGCHVLFVDLDWTPEINAQAVARAMRIGQTRAVQVISMVADHKIDKNQQKLLLNKQSIVDASTNASSRMELTDETKALEDATKLSSLIEMESLEPHNSHKASSRLPETYQEKWASQGLLVLSSMDADHATKQNYVGFNSTDTNFGNVLAFKIATSARLTDRQWQIAVMMLKKYKRQIGECPD